jgi:hypothetical protein
MADDIGARLDEAVAGGRVSGIHSVVVARHGTIVLDILPVRIRCAAENSGP